jgi:hypothetical protein
MKKIIDRIIQNNRRVSVIRIFLICIISALTSVCASAALTSGANNEDYDKTDILHRLLLDSVCVSLQDKPIIWYAKGHHVSLWSLIAKIDNDIKIYFGRNSNGGDCYVEQYDVNELDSVLYGKRNKDLISWGFDLLPNEATKMAIVESNKYNPFSSLLIVFSNSSDCVFSSISNESYSGTNATEFNDNIDKLRLLLYWLSCPEIREYISESCHPDVD